jgi:UDP-N-acetylmuramate--alanine ligase
MCGPINLRVDQGAMLFDVQLSDRIQGDSAALQNVRFPMLGDHNVQNCLAAIGVGVGNEY